MDWYCVLTDQLLSNVNEDNIANEENTTNKTGSPNSVRKQLEQRIIELYKAILQYQMKSVCSYYRNQYKEFFFNLVDLKDWDGARTDVESAENTLKEDWEQYRKTQAMELWGNLVNLTRTNQSQLMDIGQTLKEVITLQKVMRMDDEKQQCIHDLRVVSPQDDMARIEKEKEEYVDDASDWIFQDDKYAAFTTWDEYHLPPCRVLWVKGGAGTGKTMLLVGIIRKLSQQSAVFSPTLSYFFCQSKGKTAQSLNNATATIRSLMWMLLLQQDLIKHLQTDYRLSGKQLFTDVNAPFAMRRVFEKMLEDAQPVYFIVDALDECDEGLEDLIELISTSLTLSNKVRWLVSSRPEVDINNKLRNLGSKNPAIAENLVELDMQNQKSHVTKYIKHKLSKLKRSKVGYSYTEEIMATLLNEISERAKDNLLWMSLVFKDFETMRGLYAVNKVEEYPAGLPELYDHKMTKLKNAKHPQHCRDVLVATSLAYRPISLSELAVLVPLPDGTDPYTIVEECDSFLTISEETVSLIHKSAKDYLMDYHVKIQSGAAQGHANIIRSSISAMSSTLKRDIYDLRHWAIKLKDITPPARNPLAPIEYSCVFWLDHLCDAINADPEKGKALYDLGYEFFKEHFLHWLESLSLLREISGGVFSIRKLMAVAQVLHNSPFTAQKLNNGSRCEVRAHSLLAS